MAQAMVASKHKCSKCLDYFKTEEELAIHIYKIHHKKKVAYSEYAAKFTVKLKLCNECVKISAAKRYIRQPDNRILACFSLCKDCAEQNFGNNG